MNLLEEQSVFEKIRKGDEKAFEQLFNKYYAYLCLFASKIIEDDISAEETVQDIFVKIWEKREQLSIETSVKNYLFRSVKNACLNYIKHQKTRAQYAKYVLDEAEQNNYHQHFVEVDLAKKIEESIQSLPEKRRKIFQMSREDGLKYREIADKLKISVKTVEAQMGLAIKSLRDKLKNYYTFLIVITTFLMK